MSIHWPDPVFDSLEWPFDVPIRFGVLNKIYGFLKENPKIVLTKGMSDLLISTEIGCTVKSLRRALKIMALMKTIEVEYEKNRIVKIKFIEVSDKT
jgi:hypothetical protein